MRVAEVLRYESYEDMLSAHGVQAYLPNSELSVAEAAEMYRNNFTKPAYKVNGREKGAVGLRLLRL